MNILDRIQQSQSLDIHSPSRSASHDIQVWSSDPWQDGASASGSQTSAKAHRTTPAPDRSSCSSRKTEPPSPTPPTKIAVVHQCQQRRLFHHVTAPNPRPPPAARPRSVADRPSVRTERRVASLAGRRDCHSGRAEGISAPAESTGAGMSWSRAEDGYIVSVCKEKEIQEWRNELRSVLPGRTRREILKRLRELGITHDAEEADSEVRR